MSVLTSSTGVGGYMLAFGFARSTVSEKSDCSKTYEGKPAGDNTTRFQQLTGLVSGLEE